MKIPHRDLEEARLNTSAYLRKLSDGVRLGFRPSLFRAWQLTIYRYHQTKNEAAAKADLRQRFKQFASGARQFDDYCESLEKYFRDYQTLKHVVIDTAARISLNLGRDLDMVGEVSRLDVSLDGGYSALLIMSRRPANWEDELRMPLLQKYFAEMFSVSPQQTKVGIYVIDENHEFKSYSLNDIRDAELEARSLARRLIAGTMQR